MFKLMKRAVSYNWCNYRFINTQRKGPGSPHINQKELSMVSQLVTILVDIQAPWHPQNPPNIILDHGICDFSLW